MMLRLISQSKGSAFGGTATWVEEGEEGLIWKAVLQTSSKARVRSFCMCISCIIRPCLLEVAYVWLVGFKIRSIKIRHHYEP